MVKLSKTAKLGTKSWSLQAIETCPGSKDANGNLVPACSGCYATTGCYNFPDTKAVRADNREDAKRAGWTADMVKALSKETHFRWFDSGDMYAIELAEKIYSIAKATPTTKHWIPTRMAKFPKFADVIARMQALPNVMVRFSSDAVDGSYVPGVHGSTILPEGMAAPDGVTVCQARSEEHTSELQSH